MENLVYDVRYIRTLRELFSGCDGLFADSPAIKIAAAADADGDAGKNTGAALIGTASISYRELYLRSESFFTYLASLGLEGKRVAICAKNCPEWVEAFFAVVCGGGVAVLMDSSAPPYELSNMLEKSGAAAVIHTKEVRLPPNLAEKKITPVCIDDMDKYIEEGDRIIAAGGKGFCADAQSPDALGVLLFTSGTGSSPKCVALSQYNICYEIMSICKSVLITPEDATVALLPLHTVYGLVCGLLCPLYSGISVAFPTDIKKASSEFAVFSPTYIVSVPSMLTTFRQKILKEYDTLKTGSVVLGAGKAASRATNKLSLKIRRRLFAPVHRALGGRLLRIFCGSAPLDEGTRNDLSAFGFEIYCGYGLTETSSVCLVQSQRGAGRSDVGAPISGVGVKLIDMDDNGVGEIAVSGAGVMSGYLDDAERTAASFRDGYFLTGDLAVHTKDGAFRIVGRKDDAAVLPNGEKIYPDELASLLAGTRFIKEAQVSVFDDGGHKTVCARIYPDFSVADAIIRGNNISAGSSDYSDLLKKLIADSVREVNKSLPSYKYIKNVVICRSPLEKTSTGKIRNMSNNGSAGE